MFKKAFWGFLFGCFSLTQIKIIGYIGITELIFYFVAPFVFIQNRRLLKMHGFTTILALSVLWLLNGLISDWYRENTFENTLKGFAATYSVLSCLIVFHHLLWDDVWRVRWILLGFVVSVIYSTFYFQSGAAIEIAAATGIEAKEATLSYKLTVLSIVNSLSMIPIFFWYLKIPVMSALIALFMAMFALLQGGRSAFLVALLTVGIMLLSGNSRYKIIRINRKFYLLASVLVLFGFLASKTYKYAATHGIMGEAEQTKYEIQMDSKIGVLSGRGAFVGATLAIFDSPILGYGTWALDWKGYGERAAELIGTPEKAYNPNVVRRMPGHSCLFGCWIWHGLFGGVFWLYILRVIYCTIKYNLGVEPRLYGYLAIIVPSLAWDVFFSPFGSRPLPIAAITVMLLLENNRKHNNRYTAEVAKLEMH